MALEIPLESFHTGVFLYPLSIVYGRRGGRQICNRKNLPTIFFNCNCNCYHFILLKTNSYNHQEFFQSFFKSRKYFCHGPVSRLSLICCRCLRGRSRWRSRWRAWSTRWPGGRREAARECERSDSLAPRLSSGPAPWLKQKLWIFGVQLSIEHLSINQLAPRHTMITTIAKKHVHIYKRFSILELKLQNVKLFSLMTYFSKQPCCLPDCASHCQ